MRHTLRVILPCAALGLSACRSVPSPALLLAGHDEVVDPQVDGRALIYMDADHHGLKRLEMSGGPPITLAHAKSPLAFALDATSVHRLDCGTGSVQRAP